MTKRNNLTAEDMTAFAPAEKVGIVATVNDDNLPHISLLTSLMGNEEKMLTIGEFSKGLSKGFMERNKKVAFALLTMDKRLWRGRAVWNHLSKEGPRYDEYNQQPMFRYNTYFGINTVHYLDLIDIEGPDPLPMGGIIASAVKTMAAKGGAAAKGEETILKPFALKLFNKLDALKFLAAIDAEGFPFIIPVIQCQAADTGRLIFHPGPFGQELDKISGGSPVALFGLTMQMEDVLIRGTYRAPKRYRGIKGAVIDIDWVYNSMPPNHGQIYPRVPLEAVREF